MLFGPRTYLHFCRMLSVNVTRTQNATSSQKPSPRLIFNNLPLSQNTRALLDGKRNAVLKVTKRRIVSHETAYRKYWGNNSVFSLTVLAPHPYGIGWGRCHRMP